MSRHSFIRLTRTDGRRVLILPEWIGALCPNQEVLAKGAAPIDVVSIHLTDKVVWNVLETEAQILGRMNNSMGTKVNIIGDEVDPTAPEPEAEAAAA